MGILLGRNDTNPSIADEDGQTPASWAVRNGHHRIAEMLRDREDSIAGYAASLQTIELSSPEPSELSEPLSKGLASFNNQ